MRAPHWDERVRKAQEDEVSRMAVIERWTIWNRPGTHPSGIDHWCNVEGPKAGEWSSEGVEVVPASQLRGAVPLCDVLGFLRGSDSDDHEYEVWRRTIADDLEREFSTDGGQS